MKTPGREAYRAEGHFRQPETYDDACLNALAMLMSYAAHRGLGPDESPEDLEALHLAAEREILKDRFDRAAGEGLCQILGTCVVSRFNVPSEQLAAEGLLTIRIREKLFDRTECETAADQAAIFLGRILRSAIVNKDLTREEAQSLYDILIDEIDGTNDTPSELAELVPLASANLPVRTKLFDRDECKTAADQAAIFLGRILRRAIEMGDLPGHEAVSLYNTLIIDIDGPPKKTSKLARRPPYVTAKLPYSR